MARPDLVLHIGVSKTGTSSIQRVLGARRAELAALGVHYPLTPGWANHGLLPASLVPVSQLGHFNPAVWEGMQPAARLDRFRRDFARELAEMPAATRLLLISAEQMGGLLTTPATVGALRDLLAPHVGRVRVVAYLRRQDSHFASGYTQALRVGHVAPPRFPEGGPERHRQYDYAALLDLWAGIFGEDAVTPRIFERESLLGGDVVDDFLALCGIPLAVPADDPDRQSNLSLTRGGIELVRAVGARLAASPEGLRGASPLWRRFVQAAGEALPGRGWRPPPAAAAAFLARFAAVNEAARRRWFPDRPALFTPPEAAPGPATDAAALDTATLDIGAALDAACTLLLHEARGALAREAMLQAQIAHLRDRLGEAEPALAAWRAVLRADPTHPQAQHRMAEHALSKGDRKAAEAHLAALRAAHPGHRLTERLAKLLGG